MTLTSWDPSDPRPPTRNPARTRWIVINVVLAMALTAAVVLLVAQLLQ